MTYRQVHTGDLEYTTITEALACDLWLKSFRTMHYADIRPPGTVQEVSAFIPPGLGGGVGRLTFTLHYETVDEAAGDVLVNELEAAIVQGGVATASGGSDGTQPE